MKKLFLLASVLLILSACIDPAQGRTDYETAVKYLRGTGVPQDEKKGTYYLKKAAQEGNADAQLALGFSYLKGRGVEQDPKKAFELFSKAGTQGNVDAMYNAGLACVRGEGAEKNLTKAAEWFEKAAFLDDSGSQYNLGVMYLNGDGVKRDPVLAYGWFKLAGEKNYDGAAEGMASAKNALSKDELKTIDREVAKLSRQIKRTGRIRIAVPDQGADQPL